MSPATSTLNGSKQMAKGNTTAAQDAATPPPDPLDKTAAGSGGAIQAAQNNGKQNPLDKTPPPPESVKLAAPYGFINDETGEHHYWQAGQEVTDPDEIKRLVERQAPLE
ncbi:MAG TPA: hypothetical protein ACQGQH_10480 [Xylella sp.]